MARITVDEAVAALRLSQVDSRLEGLINAYDEYLTRIIGDNPVPENVQKEALTLLVAYTFDRPVAPGTTWAAVTKNSGAATVMKPWIRRYASAQNPNGTPPSLSQDAQARIPDPRPGPFQVWKTDGAGIPAWRDEVGTARGGGNNPAIGLRYGTLQPNGVIEEEAREYLYDNKEAITLNIERPLSNLPLNVEVSARGFYFFDVPPEYELVGTPAIEDMPWTQDGTRWTYRDEGASQAGFVWVTITLNRIDDFGEDPADVPLIEKATPVDVINAEDDEKYVTVLGVYQAIAIRIRAAVQNLVRANSDDVIAGIDNVRYMTVARTVQAITRFVKTASRTVVGQLALARNADVDNDDTSTYDDTRALTTKSGNRLIARRASGAAASTEEVLNHTISNSELGAKFADLLPVGSASDLLRMAAWNKQHDPLFYANDQRTIRGILTSNYVHGNSLAFHVRGVLEGVTIKGLETGQSNNWKRFDPIYYSTKILMATHTSSGVVTSMPTHWTTNPELADNSKIYGYVYRASGRGVDDSGHNIVRRFTAPIFWDFTRNLRNELSLSDLADDLQNALLAEPARTLVSGSLGVHQYDEKGNYSRFTAFFNFKRIKPAVDANPNAAGAQARAEYIRIPPKARAIVVGIHGQPLQVIPLTSLEKVNATIGPIGSFGAADNYVELSKVMIPSHLPNYGGTPGAVEVAFALNKETENDAAGPQLLMAGWVTRLGATPQGPTYIDAYTLRIHIAWQ